MIILISIISVYFTKKESFVGVANVPVDISTQNRKKFLWSAVPGNKENPLLMENNFRKWEDDFFYRDDMTTSKTGYTPEDLQNVLNPFITKSPYDEFDFEEVSSDFKIDNAVYKKKVENLGVLLTNAIFQDLFKNPHRAKYIMCPNINDCRIELIRDKIVDIKRHRNQNIERWGILLNLTIHQKAYSYGILCILEEDKPIAMKIVGVMPEDQYRLKPNYKRDPQLMIASEDYLPYGGPNDYYRYNEDDRVIRVRSKKKQQKMVDDYLERQRLRVSLPNLKPLDLPEEYSCYGSWGSDKTECENNFDHYYRVKEKGTWDRICKCDAECPFFRANKNYKNNLGGCIEGKCEMPIGIKPLGNRFYDVDSKAMCYNCPEENPFCCNEQASPDYRFSGDIYLRKIHEKELNERGLKLT